MSDGQGIWVAFFRQPNFGYIRQKGRVGGMSSSNESSFSFIVEGVEARKHSCSTRYYTHKENAHACLRIRGKFLKLLNNSNLRVDTVITALLYLQCIKLVRMH